MAARLSIILPTRDRPGMLRNALASIARQGRADTEVVVIDDGVSAPDAVVRDFGTDLDVRLLSLPAGSGPSAARNRGIGEASGEYLSFLDDDDILLPGVLDAAIEELDAGTADAVYATAGVSRTWIPPDVTGPPDLPYRFDFRFDDRFLSVLNFIPPTGLVLRAGDPVRFDTGLRAGEDWDLWLRLSRRHGYRFVHLDRLGAVYHRIPAHSMSDDPVGNGRRALRMFHDGYRRMCARWPVPDDSPEDGYRGLVLRVYEQAFARYDAGRTLGAYWYERMVRTLYDGLCRGVPPGELASGLPRLLADS